MGDEGPSSGGWEYSTSGKETGLVIPPDMRVTYPFHSLLCLALPNMTQFLFVLGFTICQCQWALMSFPLLHIHVPSEVHGHITLPKVFTNLWWMLQWMSMAEVVTSH